MWGRKLLFHDIKIEDTDNYYNHVLYFSINNEKFKLRNTNFINQYDSINLIKN